MNNTLTDHQQIALRAFEIQCDHMPCERLKEVAIALMQSLYQRENATKELLAHQWGIPTK